MSPKNSASKIQSAEAKHSGGHVRKGGPAANAQRAAAKAKQTMQREASRVQSQEAKQTGNVKRGGPAAGAQSAADKL